jgi:ribonuclease D
MGESLFHLLIANPANLQMVISAIGESGPIGLDIETTGLDPRTDRLRLLSLACDTVDGGTAVYVIDAFAVPDLTPLWQALAAATIVGHNLLFDLQFLARLGFAPRTCRDTMLMTRVLQVGNPDAKSHKLADCCQRDLNEGVNKAKQTSD